MHSSTSFKGCIFHSTSHFFHEVMHIYGDEAVLSTCNALKGALFTFGFKAPGSVVLQSHSGSTPGSPSSAVEQWPFSHGLVTAGLHCC